MSSSIPNKGGYELKELMKLIGLILLVVFLFILVGFIISYAWNGTMPYIFSLPEIDIGQGIALFVLFQILFTAKLEINKD